MDILPLSVLWLPEPVFIEPPDYSTEDVGARDCEPPWEASRVRQ
jgi:hypothetical protein